MLRSLAESWKASMASFQRPNARYFFLESLNATWGIYKACIFGALWLIALIILSFKFQLGAIGLLHTMLFFVALCSARSSIGIKNSTYFFEKIAHYFLIYWLMTYFVMQGFIMATPWLLQAGGEVLKQAVLINCSIFLTLAGLCLIDSGFWLKSMLESPARTAPARL